MLSYQKIRLELDKMCILLQRQVPDEELDIISMEWQEVFQETDEHTFSEALRKHRSSSSFFPTQAEVQAQIDILRKRAVTNHVVQEMHQVTHSKYAKVWAILAKKALLGDVQAKEFFKKEKEEQDSFAQDYYKNYIFQDSATCS